MTPIIVQGCGAVSPAGWGIKALREALQANQAIPCRDLQRPGWSKPLRVRQVPPANPRPSFLAHARLRRTSPITHYLVAAALEALGAEAARVQAGTVRLGIIVCVLSGCVNYSRRFYDETLRDPATASPLIFPETVFNAPASHLAALLGTTAINYTLVGDPGTYLQGLALGAQWLLEETVDGCLVVGAEEMDWLTSDAIGHFTRSIILGEGAGALYLKREASSGAQATLSAITNSILIFDRSSREAAAEQMRALLPEGGTNDLLCDGLHDHPELDRAESLAWKDWPGSRLSPRTILGDGLAVSAAWQCVAAIDSLRQGHYAGANVSIVGRDQQAIGARFVSMPRTLP